MSWDVSEGPQSSDSFPRFLIDPSILWAKCKHLVCIKGKYIIYALLPYGAVKKAFIFKSEGLCFSLISCYLSNFDWVAWPLWTGSARQLNRGNSHLKELLGVLNKVSNMKTPFKLWISPNTSFPASSDLNDFFS